MFISAEPSTGQLSGESFPADLASSVIQDDESMTGSVPVRDTRTREVRGLADAWIAAPINAKRVPKPRVRDELIYMNKCKINQVLFTQAMKDKPDEALLALDKELDNTRNAEVWGGVLFEDLSPEQQKLILPMMLNFVVKYKPDGEFDKYKVRVLGRGDLQFEVGETTGPVCRVENIFLSVIIAAYYDFEIFEIDFVAAYLNTIMPDSVSHKWLMLDRIVSKRLIETDPGYWTKYLRKDGRILVYLYKLIYGFKEAAFYWNQILISMFLSHGWVVSTKDECVLTYQTSDKFAMVCITVDDCLFTVTRGNDLKEDIISMCKNTFSGITITEGDTINVVGIRFQMDRVNKAVKVDQRKFVQKTVSRYGNGKKSKLPFRSDLFKEHSDSPLLDDQLSFLSIVSSNMFGAKRTYPEILSVCTTSAEKFGKATQYDMDVQIKCVEYLHETEDIHCMYFRPKSLRVIASADASYAETSDAKSRTGGCVGFEGYDGCACYFMFISQKQSIVAKSSCEAELIALDTVASHVEYLLQMLDSLGEAFCSKEPAIIYQDNISTMRIAEAGKGTFKRSKHINVRYFWVKQIIDFGRVILEYVCTLFMVADILTKPVTRERFFALIGKLLGWDSMPEGKPEFVDGDEEKDTVNDKEDFDTANL
jgi:hypothetical protein